MDGFCGWFLPKKWGDLAGAGAAHLWDGPEDPHGSHGAGPRGRPKWLVLAPIILQDGAENMEKSVLNNGFHHEKIEVKMI